MKKLSIALLALVALSWTAAAGEVGDQLRALATKVDALEAKACPVCPVPEQPAPEPEQPSTSNPFDALYPSGFALPALAADAIPTMAKPSGKASSFTTPTYIDPVYKTRVYRATQASDGSGTHVLHEYSRRQAWNSGNTRYVAQASNGYWFVYDASTFKPLRQLSGPAGDAEVIWSSSDPRRLLYTGMNGQGGVWYWLDVETNTRTTAFSLAGKAPYPSAKSFWTKAEGTTSADGRYLALMAETYNSNGSVTFYGVLTVDVTTGAVVGSRASSQRPDHVSISPSGRWAVISGDGSEGTIACPRTFDSPCKKLHTKSEHSDLAYGPNREDFYVYTDYTTGQIVAKNIDSGASFNLTSLYPASGSAYAAHISGQAYEKPGWVAITSYGDYGSYGSASPDPKLQPQYRKVFLAELKPGGRLLSVAHTRQAGTGYFDEPQATVSRDLSRIMWHTNLGAGVSDSVMVGLPSSVTR